MIERMWQTLKKFTKFVNDANRVNISWHVKGDLKINEPLNFNSECDPNLDHEVLSQSVTWRERATDSARCGGEAAEAM